MVAMRRDSELETEGLGASDPASAVPGLTRHHHDSMMIMAQGHAACRRDSATSESESAVRVRSGRGARAGPGPTPFSGLEPRSSVGRGQRFKFRVTVRRRVTSLLGYGHGGPALTEAGNMAVPVRPSR
jgi:hypothetical protein